MRLTFSRWTLIAAAAVAGTAQAHPGHAGGALAGLAHPFQGFDHLLAMLAVGIWAWQLGGRARWMLPLSFVGMLAAGAALAVAGFALPMVESGILISVLLLGALIAAAKSMPTGVAAGMVGLFALFHGYAHGAEMPALAAPWQYGLGFIGASALLHGLGLATASSLRLHAGLVRISGVAIAASVPVSALFLMLARPV
ncbi:HupE/UreJ family protein [Oxalobacteraceae bacterium]|nr:HupE/UreJ family protein [Oxalobacteraceae bacterium]